MIWLPLAGGPQTRGANSYLGQHASPCDDLGVDRLARLLLMGRNGSEEAVQVFVDAVVVAYEAVVAGAQVGARTGRIVPFYR